MLPFVGSHYAEIANKCCRRSDSIWFRTTRLPVFSRVILAALMVPASKQLFGPRRNPYASLFVFASLDSGAGEQHD